MKKNSFSLLFWMAFIMLTISSNLVRSQNTTEDIKIFPFSATGHIGNGRAADYLPCFEPFYFRVNTGEMPGRKITSVTIWIYDSQGTGSSIAPSVKTNGTKMSTTLFTNTANTYTTTSLYTDYGIGRQARVFNSVQSGENELLIYINVNLDYKRYYYLEYDISYVADGSNGASATAALTNSVVTAINITNGGINYFAQPSVLITGGGGTGAVGTVDVAGGKITGVNITNGGSGYVSSPSILFYGTLHSTTRIYSTALKQDVNSVEAYTGLGISLFGKPGNQSKFQPGFTFAAGAKIHVSPVYSHPMRNRYSLNNWSRLSVTVGAALGKFNYAGSEIKQISDFVNPIFGIDFEPFEYASIHVGTILGMQESIYTSSTQKRLVAGFFFGINLTPNVFTQASKNSSGFKFPIGTGQ